MSLKFIFGAVIVLGGALPATAAPMFFAGTGSYYERVDTWHTWDDALTAAASMSYLGQQGRLVTINSAAENTFILDNLLGVTGDPYWIGGYQPAGSTEPGGGWRWITNEPFDFTFWHHDEPNNFGGQENYLEIYDNGIGDWNDYEVQQTVGYIVEYPSPVIGQSIPEPASLLVFSMVGGIVRKRHR